MSKIVRLYEVAFFARPFNAKAKKRNISKLDNEEKGVLAQSIRVAAGDFYEAERLAWARLREVLKNGSIGPWVLNNIYKTNTRYVTVNQVFSA